MTSILRLGGVVLIGVALYCGSGDLAAQSGVTAAGDLSLPGVHTVEVIEFPALVDPARGRKVPTKVHLPSDGGPYPIVVVSHGAGGHWDANFAQARHLATHGYAVLALEHVGSNTEVLRRSMRLRANLEAMTRNAEEVLSRPQDIGFAISQAERWNQSHDRLRGRMDPARVGALGHSFGAYTVLVVGGMKPALDWLSPVVASGRGLGPDLHDPRVRCGVALSPQGPGEPFFIESSFQSLRVPMLGISGSHDEQQRAPPENRRRSFELWPAGGKYLVWLTGADHTAFSDSTGSSHRMLPSASRADVQPLVRAATLAFFDQCLKNEGEARTVLTEQGLGRYVRGAVGAVEVRAK